MGLIFEESRRPPGRGAAVLRWRVRPRGAMAFAAGCALALAALSARAQGADLEIARQAIAGGGGSATGDGLRIEATLGQATVGSAGDGAQRGLHAGYWVPVLVLSFDLDLAFGWNLVSVPIQPLDGGVDTVFQGLQAGRVWEWSRGAYRPATEIVPGTGYWLYCTTPATARVRGRRVSDPVRELAAGWALIGPVAGPPYAPVPLPLECEPAGSLCLPLWGFSAGGCTPVVSALECGQGYWVYSRRRNVVWSADATVPLSTGDLRTEALGLQLLPTE